jgi:hypothetical protein
MQATEPSLLMPLGFAGALTRVVLVGDDKQLGPLTVMGTSQLGRYKLNCSAFERLKAAGVYAVMLDTQFRRARTRNVKPFWTECFAVLIRLNQSNEAHATRGQFLRLSGLLASIQISLWAMIVESIDRT